MFWGLFRGLGFRVWVLRFGVLGAWHSGLGVVTNTIPWVSEDKVNTIP